MIATSADVAKRAGVSRSTVSQILNGRGASFADETRRRVEQAVSDLGYEPSTAGRTLARGSSDIVIALIPNTTFGSNLQAIFDALTDELSERGLTLVLRFSTNRSAALDRLIIGMKPRAVVSLVPFSPEELRLLEQRGVQAIDPGTVQGNINCDIGALQAAHLVDRGHRRLAFAHLKDLRDDPFGGTRETGFREESERLGATVISSIQVGLDRSSALEALRGLGDPGVGVACYNDEVAIALMFAAHTEGWSIPDDIALIGMDHIALTELMIPSLTTIGYELETVTRMSVDSILASLDQQEVADEPTSYPSFRLVAGQTT